MSTEVGILAATALLAVVAISAAVIAVRAARRLSVAVPPAPEPLPAPPRLSTEIAHVASQPEVADRELEPRIVEGRLIVPPSELQVVNTALGRPGVRLSVLAHGLAHALRAESRDRVMALMRREYRSRRRERLQAGRRAVRAAQPTEPADRWLSS
ncbi:hypothetical protein C6I20_09130 [Aeromicrobium sp. A1-2]|uniref:hypothetical protein n=1 Tax=Aeromicrobium sp. A1-2 TaxID=2107713 RepID=UPI000E52F8EF|nr:hypothetical protein [Aeromicrobium sp. A1-2]AXT85333.1 hypothetical protein C6I20_09130 [Aeromicrobium sp. A1-2]